VKPEEEYPLLGIFPLALILLNKEGEITHANELAQSYTGTSLHRLQGKHLTDFLQPSSEICNMIERTLAGETVRSDAFCGRQNHMPYAIHFGPLHDQQGSIIALTPEANRVEVEEHARRYEIAETIAHIALEMAHEVKNPLASLRGAAQLLHEQSAGEQAEITAHILAEVDRIKERIDSFLQVGPRANMEKTNINIHALLDNVCVAPKNIQFRRIYDPSIPLFQVHEARLRQALENLWLNALEADSSIISWETRIAPMVALPDHHGMVIELSIRSNGAPVPEHVRERLFTPYVSGKERGSGLGLAVVQRVVQEHGGRIGYKSIGSESLFTMHLPI